ncbi:hypothetical protein [Hymenobacter sp.]|uniref:hypothetical protein n=1 Tax=Hymenobacter sp. TaxID=1898978 RepID=UPI002EDAA40D
MEKSVSLTGLGVLLLPQQVGPLLQDFDLYTQWLVHLVFPNGSEAKATASIEEISRPSDSPGAVAVEKRALLLTQEGIESVPAGTLVYLREQQDPFAI